MPALDALGLIASDLAASAAFYRLLGMDFPEPNGDEHIEATAQNGMRLMLDSERLMKRMDESWTRPEGYAFGLALLCESAAEVDEVFAAVKKAGYDHAAEPFDAFWGQRYATVLDPDGYRVDLFAPLANQD